MYIMYIDESGDTIPLSQKGKKFLVLTGAVINEDDILDIETKFRSIKEKYFQDPDLESFQKYLEEVKGLGICIIDPREGQVEKSFIGQELERIHNKIRWSTSELSNIVERLLFATSDKTIGIQIADLYCYPIYHIFEYDKTKGEYWRFDELSSIKLYKDDGLRFYPDKTKKDLRFFG